MKSVAYALSLALVFCAGCGGGSGSQVKLVPVAGVAKFKGQPIADSLITFFPESGPAGVGRTDASGNFQIKTNGQLGAVVGKHHVTVSGSQEASMETPPTDGKEMEWEAKKKSTFSPKYSDAKTTDLVIDLAADGNKTLVLDLTE